MVAFAIGFEMDIGLIAGSSAGLHRRILFLPDQLLESVKDLLADQVPLLNPALSAAEVRTRTKRRSRPSTCTASPFLTAPVLL